MYAAHESYRDNCQLSVPEVDFLVEAVRKRGAKAGLYGAKITGGGTGGTVAVFGKMAALKEHIPQIAVEYSRRVGEMPDIFEGTSPGAMEFGARRYVFGAKAGNGLMCERTKCTATRIRSVMREPNQGRTAQSRVQKCIHFET